MNLTQLAEQTSTVYKKYGTTNITMIQVMKEIRL